MDEFFNMAALLLLDDMKIALMLTWAFEISENECFFGIVLVGNQLPQVMNHASRIFESPAWAWRDDESIEWFGFDMSKAYSFEDKQQILEQLPEMSSALRRGMFLDLGSFVDHMHNLSPTCFATLPFQFLYQILDDFLCIEDALQLLQVRAWNFLSFNSQVIHFAMRRLLGLGRCQTSIRQWQEVESEAFRLARSSMEVNDPDVFEGLESLVSLKHTRCWIYND